MTRDSKVRLGSNVRPGPMTPEELSEFLQRPLLARLATTQPDGAPYVVPLWFHWDGEAFYLVIRPRALFLHNLRHEPRVCLSIASDTHPYARVTVHGRGEMIPPGASELWIELTRLMTMRYVGDIDPGYAERTLMYPRWIVKVKAEKLTSWRGGGWHRRYTEPEASKSGDD